MKISTRKQPARGGRLRRWGGAALLAALAFAVGAGFQALSARYQLPQRGPAALANLKTRALAQWRAEPLRIHVDIAHKHWVRIAERRNEAVERGVLISTPDDMVPATLSQGDDSVRAKVRLKGNFPDHWADHKWSLRVSVRGEGTLLGMRQFSLQHPRTRRYADEWVLHQALLREGLPALRYDFVEVVLNGREMGVYALEEHFDKQLLENRGRPEGPILRFNEDLCFAEVVRGLGFPCGGSGSGGFLAAEVDVFHTRRTYENPEHAAWAQRGAALLEGFRQGELSTSEAFDVPQMARLLAVLDNFVGLHAAGWRNSRFYFNPVTSKLEPIGYDAGGTATDPVIAPLVSAFAHPQRDNDYYYHYLYIDRLFEDPVFYRAYLRELERISEEGYLEQFLAEIEPELQRKLDILHTEFPWVELNLRPYWAKRKFIRDTLSPTKAVHAFLQARGAGRATLEVGNLQYLPLELLGFAGGPSAAPGAVELPARRPNEPVRYRPVAFQLPDAESAEAGVAAAPLVLRYRIAGSRRVGQAEVFPRERPDPEGGLPDVTRVAPNVGEFGFIERDESARELQVKPGVWRIDRDLVVPPGWRLRMGPATTLVLGGGAVLLTRSPIEWVGSEESPVIVRAEEGTGQGVVVMASGERSVLDRVRFEGLGEPERPGWSVSGGVTLYESPVEIRECEFVGIRGEAALNLIRSPFSLERSVFRDSRADSLDIDFSAGKLRDVSFVRTGGNAVDASGSALEIDGLWIDTPGGKGISAGQASRVSARRIRIRGARVGIASQDLSEARIEQIELAQSGVGFAAFQERAEFGGGVIEVASLGLDAVDAPFLIESGSRMRLDGELVDADELRVHERLQAE